MIISVDVGLSGAVACFTDAGEFLEVFDIPTMQANGKQAYVKNVVNSAGLAKRLPAVPATLAFVETVTAMPASRGKKGEQQDGEPTGWGVSSIFSLGCTLCSITSVLAVLGIPYLMIRPQEWKKHFRLSRDKEEARCRALQLYPDAALYLARKKDHNRAEAILIGRYGIEKQAHMLDKS
jgi:crossover junction endodeoxyribonuclease RuvC